MSCPKKAMKIAKRIGREITPSIVRVAVAGVTKVEELAIEDPAFFTNDAKRKIVGAEIKAQARREGVTLATRSVNLLNEFAVEAVKGPDDESDLGNDPAPEDLGILADDPE